MNKKKIILKNKEIIHVTNKMRKKMLVFIIGHKHNRTKSKIRKKIR